MQLDGSNSASAGEVSVETTGVSTARPVMLRAERPLIAHHWPFAVGTECHGHVMSRDVTTG